MSRQSKQDYTFSPLSISFRRFWLLIASELGNARLRLNSDTNKIHCFVLPHSDHPSYLKDVILGSFKPNTAGGLDQTIDLTALLDSLGDTAFQLRLKQEDDLFDIELLEEIAWHIGARFKHLIEMPSQSKDCPHATSPLNASHCAAVSSLALRKLRRENSKL